MSDYFELNQSFEMEQKKSVSIYMIYPRAWRL